MSEPVITITRSISQRGLEYQLLIEYPNGHHRINFYDHAQEAFDYCARIYPGEFLNVNIPPLTIATLLEEIERLRKYMTNREELELRLKLMSGEAKLQLP